MTLITQLCIIAKRIEDEDRAEIWRTYMASIVPSLYGEGCMTYQEALESFKARKEPEKKADTSEAYSNAKACAEALEQARR